MSLVSSALVGRFFTSALSWEAHEEVVHSREDFTDELTDKIYPASQEFS